MIDNLLPICIDANIVLRLVLGGPHVEEVREHWAKWIHEDKAFFAPSLFSFEITSVIWREVYQKILTPAEGRQALQTALSLGVRLIQSQKLHGEAFEVARRFNLTQAYDAHYVALAERLDCEFWTLDHKLHKALQSRLPLIHTIP